jgi:hypothetical protein
MVQPRRLQSPYRRDERARFWFHGTVDHLPDARVDEGRDFDASLSWWRSAGWSPSGTPDRADIQGGCGESLAGVPRTCSLYSSRIGMAGDSPERSDSRSEATRYRVLSGRPRNEAAGSIHWPLTRTTHVPVSLPRVSVCCRSTRNPMSLPEMTGEPESCCCDGNCGVCAPCPDAHRVTPNVSARSTIAMEKRSIRGMVILRGI